jgi:hypothetical protein
MSAIQFTNSAGTRVCSDDVARLLLNWLTTEGPRRECASSHRAR